MTRTTVTEQELRTRLQQAGKTSDEIEAFVAEYIEASALNVPDLQVITGLLQKTGQDKFLRVSSFNLSSEQYNALMNWCEDSKLIEPSQKVKSDFLVKKALEEFISML